MHNYLFVCAGNAVRSPFCEEWFRRFAARNAIPCEVRSAGAYVPQDDKWFTPVNEELLDWADKTIVMEFKMQCELVQRYGHGNRIVTLGVPDIFSPTMFEAREAGPLFAYELYKKSGYRVHFGPKTFIRILEANLEKILLPDDWTRYTERKRAPRA